MGILKSVNVTPQVVVTKTYLTFSKARRSPYSSRELANHRA